MTHRTAWAVLTLTLLAGCGSALDDTTSSLVRVAGTACLSPILATAIPVEDELVLTVAHAIAGAENDLRIVRQNGSEMAVEVVAFDPERDLALLKVPGLEAPPILLAKAAVADTGVIAVVEGDLKLVTIPYEIARLVTASSGDIYDHGRVLREVFDLQAEVGPGNSGAPLLNSQGEMVGMVFAATAGSQTSAWALTETEIAAFLDSNNGRTVVDRGRCR